MAKFRGDRPRLRDCGDLVTNEKRKKERKKETAAKHKGRSRFALSQRAALMSTNEHAMQSFAALLIPIRDF